MLPTDTLAETALISGPAVPPSARVLPARTRPWWERLYRWAVNVAGTPRGSIWLCAAAAVLVSCYPVVFLGKSFLSPNQVDVPLLYPWNPAVPGVTDLRVSGVPGSDLGAMLWQNMPYSVLESRAVMGERAFPFWNRYNSCGVPLFGQSISMFADPLHLLVVLAGGTSWAWDAKFLLAKLLFAAGTGFSVWAATRHRPIALLLTVSSAFLGFFSFRFNHPAFFSLCYAPWILVCWLNIVQARTVRGELHWTLGLLLANWMEMNSGTAKEAYMLLLGLNGTGLLVFWLAPDPVGTRRGKFLHLLAAGGIFVLLSAPVWLTFLDTLHQSWTIYDHRAVWQVQPALFVGLFDNLFYLPFGGGAVFDPSTNFFVLLGSLYLLVHLRGLLRDRVCLGFALGALLPIALIFGIVPPGVISVVPFLNNVVHVDNTFSCVFIVQAFVLAGFGFRAAWERLRAMDGRWLGDLGMVALGFGTILGAYLGCTQANQRGVFIFPSASGEIPKGDFLPLYAATLVIGALALPWAIRRALRGEGRRALNLGLATVCFGLLHWRHGQQVPTPFGSNVISPPIRANLLTSSPSVDYVRGRQVDGPSRAVGFDNILFPGYSGALGVEAINGPDALMNPYYRGLIEATGKELVWGWCVVTDKETFPNCHALYDLLNVRYYLGPMMESAPVPGLHQVGEADLRVYESRTAWPRAFFTDQVGVCADARELLQQVSAGDGRPFAAVDPATLAEMPALAELRAAAGSSPRHLALPRDWRLTTNETAFTITAPSAGVIVLSEVYMPRDFEVTVNGAAASYFRANHAFKGIAVDRPGSYRISFRYRPFRWGATLLSAAVGLGLLVAWTGFRVYSSR